MLFIYPADYFDKTKPDEQYALEYAMARQCGHDVALYDDIEHNILPHFADFHGAECCWRGWQMTEDEYAEYSRAVMKANGSILTSPSEYITYHDAANYAEYLPSYPPAAVIDGDDLEKAAREIANLIEEWKPSNGLFIKDSVKCVESLIHLEKISPNDILYHLQAIKSTRENSFSGKFMVRPWCDSMSDQVRVFMYCNRPICAGKHYNHGFDDAGRIPTSEEAISLAETITAKSPLIAIDVAKDDSDNLIVVEIGDGQVSELPAECYEEFYRAMPTR